MQKIWARMPFFLVLLAVCYLVLPSRDEADAAASPVLPTGPAPRTVYLARDLSADNLIVLSASVAARDPSAVLLLDAPAVAEANRAFLADFRPSRVVPVGEFPEGVEGLAQRVGLRPDRPYQWAARPSLPVWFELFPQAESVILCPVEPRELLLQAACLAGTLGAPLYIQRNQPHEASELKHLFERWKTQHVYTLGSAQAPGGDLAVTSLATDREVAALHRRLLSLRTTIRTLVVANPRDGRDGKPQMSPLAPWVALQRQAGLMLTSADASNVEDKVRHVTTQPNLRRTDTIILVADLDAIPVQKRPNPIPGDKDDVIEMEPLTPKGTEPFTFSVGRLFHPEPGIVPLMVARSHLLARRTGPRKALLVSNPGGGLPLLEAISRQTVRELNNGGFETTALFGKKVTGEQLRRQMPQHDIFVWEGHHNTLIRDWDFPKWTEPLPPSLVFLQSCLALKEWKVEPLFRRGAVGVIGSSTRTYSASGGATSLSFFDAIIHEDQNIGDALRHSKNFMMAYVLLKQRRLGEDARKSGANLRAAWAFTLWGDPTLRMTPPESVRPSAPAVRHVVQGNEIVVQLPPQKLDPVHSNRYHAEVYPNARLAGLLGKEKGDEGKALQPMVFAEVELPRTPTGKKPRLSTNLPTRNWVFNWDARLQKGYLLAVPRAKDHEELRFAIKWENEGSMGYVED